MQPSRRPPAPANHRTPPRRPWTFLPPRAGGQYPTLGQHSGPSRSFREILSRREQVWRLGLCGLRNWIVHLCTPRSPGHGTRQTSHREDSDQEGRDGSPAAAVFTHPGWQQSPFGVKVPWGPTHRLLDEHTGQDQAGNSRGQNHRAARPRLGLGPAPTVSPRAPGSGA